MRPSMAALMAPGIDHHKNENNKTQRQQHYHPRLVLPNLLEAIAKVLKIHPTALYTSPLKKPTKSWAIDDEIQVVAKGVRGSIAKG
jgi:hypothetical protein